MANPRGGQRAIMKEIYPVILAPLIMQAAAEHN